MTAPDETTAAASTRSGSAQDLARRMDRMEDNHAILAKEVGILTGTVARVELNQTHAAELNKLRFDALDVGLGTVKDSLDRFMGRINAIVSGEVKLPQAAQGEKLVADYLVWRDATDKRLDEQDVKNGKIEVLTRLAVLLIGGNAVAIVIAITTLITMSTPAR